MKNTVVKIFLSVVILSFSLLSYANATIGQPAPDFTALTSDGKSINLSDYKGKIVVLEWTNKDCPYVKKHYQSGNMQKLQNEYKNKGIIWLTILSSAPGKQGYLNASEANQQLQKDNAKPTAFVLDPSGKIGKSYNAKVTPHMYVINKNGILFYQGAIDNNSSSDANTIKNAVNYVKQAVDDLLQGKKIQTTQTRPYGCAVKYDL